jgi:hypothetical protein
MLQAARPPLARLATIDHAVRAGQYPNATTLARQLEVSPRTVQRDLTFLRDQLRAPLEFDPQRNGYHCIRPDYNLACCQSWITGRPAAMPTAGGWSILFINETLTAKDFLVWRESCQLTEDGRKRFFEAFEQRKSTVVTHPVFGYKMSYGRMLEVQARMLAAYVRGDIPEYVGFTVR